MRGYLPLTKSELSKRFPVRVLRAVFTPWDGGAARVGATIVRFVERDNVIQFSGIDRAHKKWTVSASAIMGGALYSTDIDKNGTIDLIYVAHTGGNGLAAPMHVLSLMFDETGRPYWITSAYEARDAPHQRRTRLQNLPDLYPLYEPPQPSAGYSGSRQTSGRRQSIELRNGLFRQAHGRPMGKRLAIGES